MEQRACASVCTLCTDHQPLPGCCECISALFSVLVSRWDMAAGRGGPRHLALATRAGRFGLEGRGGDGGGGGADGRPLLLFTQLILERLRRRKKRK